MAEYLFRRIHGQVPGGDRQLIISIHIPKTAGTTIGYLFDYGSRRRILYDYAEDYGESPDVEYYNRHRPFIDDHFDFIHGHFHYRKYRDVFPDAQYVSCVRNPVDRVISQFLHIAMERSSGQSEMILNGTLALEEYASNYNIGNAQTVFLRGRDLSDYDFIFITEQLAESFACFQKMTGFRRNDEYVNTGMPHLNALSRRLPIDLEITEGEKSALRKYVKDDMELYRIAVEQFEKKKARLR
jgi:Sulfotransferase family